MQLKYVGVHTGGVYVTRSDIYVPHGGVVDVPDEVAVSLLEQGGWEAATPNPPDDDLGVVDNQEDDS